jgi:hypothetical protein
MPASIRIRSLLSSPIPSSTDGSGNTGTMSSVTNHVSSAAEGSNGNGDDLDDCHGIEGIDQEDFLDDDDADSACGGTLPTTTITVYNSKDSEKNWPSPSKARMTKKNARSEVWKHFQVFKERLYKSWTFCIHCNRNVFYTDTMSTGMLIRHL